MADGTTTNFGLSKPQVGSSRDSWGDKLNANADIIDTQIKAAQTTAGGALPKAGGTVTSEILRDGQGAHFHWSDDSLDNATAFLTPATAPSPLTIPGQIWFGYSA